MIVTIIINVGKLKKSELYNFPQRNKLIDKAVGRLTFAKKKPAMLPSSLSLSVLA